MPQQMPQLSFKGAIIATLKKQGKKKQTICLYITRKQFITKEYFLNQG